MRYLGIDYGSKKVGLALSDEGGTMGFPKEIIPNTPRLLEEVALRIAKEKVGAVVIGESKNFEGEENPIAKDAHAFGDAMSERAGVAVFYESETLTSAEARRQPVEEKASLRMSRSGTRAPKSNAPVDASAAALILTSYLAKQNDHA